MYKILREVKQSGTMRKTSKPREAISGKASASYYGRMYFARNLREKTKGRIFAEKKIFSQLATLFVSKRKY
jgi:hypothetical protein